MMIAGWIFLGLVAAGMLGAAIWQAVEYFSGNRSVFGERDQADTGFAEITLAGVNVTFQDGCWSARLEEQIEVGIQRATLELTGLTLALCGTPTPGRSAELAHTVWVWQAAAGRNAWDIAQNFHIVVAPRVIQNSWNSRTRAITLNPANPATAHEIAHCWLSANGFSDAAQADNTPEMIAALPELARNVLRLADAIDNRTNTEFRVVE